MKLKKRVLVLASTLVLLLIFAVLQALQQFPGTWEVEGWGANVSRNMNDYISENLKPHIWPTQFCNHERVLLVMICSGPDNFELRNAIRQTWGQKNDNVSFFFLLGEIPNNHVTQHNLEIEAMRFDDVIQERFVDSYNNLSIKSTNMLKLFSAHCNNTRFLMKVDDDVFLNVPLLLEVLTNPSTPTSNILMGKVRSDLSPFRNKHSKWYMPYEWYPNDKYPSFVCGPSYIMSGDVARKLYTCALELPLIYMEDVFFTGICPQAMGIELWNSERFSCDRLWGGICHHKDMYTLHYYSPKEIRSSYDALQERYCEVNVLQLWLFFFSQP